jgi:iron complex outermembrane receptor protein
MKNSAYIVAILSCSAFCGTAAAQVAAGTEARVDSARVASEGEQSSQSQDIIVTAQKRSERLQDVPLSMNVATGEQLKSAGITSSDQLQRIVPGFVAVKTAYGNPVYFLRGVGFDSTTLGVAPAVSIYVDQQPLPYSPMARGAILDLERVEVLKGPQGTLFGSNSTGGAINYIAAKPTRELQLGFDATYGRFGQADIEGFVSGPISDTLSVRLAVQSNNRGDWQKGYTTFQTLGKTRFLNGRLSLNWAPSDKVDLLVTVAGWRDKSDVQQAQSVAYTPSNVGAAARVMPFPISSFPQAPDNARAAAWDVGGDFARDDWFYQLGAKLEADLTDYLHLSSLTSYARFRQSVPLDVDASTYPAFSTDGRGRIETFSQELRLSGDGGGPLKWMLGANYQRDHVTERLIIFPWIQTGAHVGPIDFFKGFDDTDQTAKSKSVFGSLDYKLSSQITLQASGRYTKQDRTGESCTRDGGDGGYANGVAFLSTRLTGTAQTIAPGDCGVLDGQGRPLPIYKGTLNEDNVSFRTSLNWKPNRDTLIYASIAKGYKSGSFPALPSPFAGSKAPIGQESVLAYEVGTKLSLGSGRFDLSGALFYYDYKDKQIYGYRPDPFFTSLPALVSIPKSSIKGAELAVTFRPLRGLQLSANGTYVQSRVARNPVNPTGPYGNVATFVGQAFPFTPKWQGTADIQYRWNLNSDLMAYVGSSVSARTGTRASLVSHAPAVIDRERLLDIAGYALLDLRAGIEDADDQWRIEIWGRNVTNSFYNAGARRTSDHTTRFTGMPVTYGVTLHYSM